MKLCGEEEAAAAEKEDDDDDEGEDWKLCGNNWNLIEVHYDDNGAANKRNGNQEKSHNWNWNNKTNKQSCRLVLFLL